MFDIRRVDVHMCCGDALAACSASVKVYTLLFVIERLMPVAPLIKLHACAVGSDLWLLMASHVWIGRWPGFTQPGIGFHHHKNKQGGWRRKGGEGGKT